ncbi:hypothetical protein ABZV92_35875 [Streptomyces rubiginosohelvolus]|uniref:hypothetical protein n=1 Tax=Streptomyces rubiginosohelvolus TaxID=67362 RepID=UPI00339E18DC
MTAETPKTGIKNADELITLAVAFGLTVTVETTDRDTLTSYVVRIAIPVPVAYAGTELGRTIAGDSVALLWTKAKKKGARGCLVDATVWSAADHRKVRTLRAINAAIDTLGHASAKYARDAAPLPEDVVDAPHAVFVDGHQVHAGIPAEHVRTIVKNRRFRGWTFHQDDENAICIEGRRYVPVQPAPAEETPAPAADERQHVRITNDGPAEIIPTREALDEINAAMMQPEVKRTVKRMSASQSTAHIVYRDGRTVYLRPATPGDVFPTPAERPTDAELTGDIDAELAAYYAETFPAIADGSALPVRADMIRPGMEVIAAHLDETRTVSAVTAFVGPGAPWVRPTWTFRSHDESTTGSTFPPDMHLMVTRASLDAVFGPAPAEDTAPAAPATPVARPAAEVLAADPIPAEASVLKGMPGREITREELRTLRDVLVHTDYVVQLRDSGAWILPNHDDHADITRGSVAVVLRRMLDNAPGHARTTLDTDGTVYVSNGRQAARYIPAALIADHSTELCPGCHTPYAANGDGPCKRTRAAELVQV